MSVQKLFAKTLSVELTPQQQDFVGILEKFLQTDHPKPTILLRGYAGTGKTLMVSTFVKVASQLGYKTALLAPTGRAAKVLGRYASKRASTIHRKIYQQVDTRQGRFVFKLVKNIAEDTIYIVDEASMISDKPVTGKKSLLDDLITFIFARPEAGNKLILVGDVAQLPPVGENTSVALDKDFLEQKYKLQVFFCEFTQVMRQAENSGILYNATNIRNLLRENSLQLALKTKGYPDFYRMTYEKLEDGLRYAYKKYGLDETIVLCRSNKNANNFNRYIRRNIRFMESEIEAGDYLMIVKNNYFVLAENGINGFLANGDMVKVRSIEDTEEKYGFRFATMVLELLDYEGEPFEAKVILNTLYSETPSLSAEEYDKLHQAVAEEYKDVGNKRYQLELLKDNPYLNALQIKFAYAITCHKSQGGQWKIVFVEQGFMTEEMINIEFLRWLYTAITRGEKEVFLINFREEFFEA
ncbi:ATP-dependent DNA helicase [Raineya sp.]|jgi:exodeoxyribonuclease-5